MIRRPFPEYWLNYNVPLFSGVYAREPVSYSEGKTPEQVRCCSKNYAALGEGEVRKKEILAYAKSSCHYSSKLIVHSLIDICSYVTVICCA